MSKRKIRRALISVYDKTGIVDFVRALVGEFGIEIISTGGTAALLKENGIPVTLVEEITGFPEMLDGRVKTLHPKIHAAILADRDNPDHMRQLKEQGIEPIDMVVVNLYPFEKTVADPNCTFEKAVEMIDIGGPSLLRAAAKNHKHVLVVCDDDSGMGMEVLYEKVVKYLQYDRSIPGDDLHPRFAKHAFWSTSTYDDLVHSWLQERDVGPTKKRLVVTEWDKTRYGENPHQTAELLTWHRGFGDEAVLTSADVGQKNTESLSFNNYADGHAALELCKELTRGLGRAKILFARHAAHESQAGEDSSRASRRFTPVSNEVQTRRKLPHGQIAGATYFVTFRSAIGELDAAERDIVLSALHHWDGKKLDLHAAVVMRDHAHALLTPREPPDRPEEHYNLSELLQSVKAHCGREISKRRGGIGQVWVRESFDRWIRSESDFEEKWLYIANNPVKQGLAPTPEAYRWWYGVEETPDQSRTKGRVFLGKENLCPPQICVFIKHTNACGVGVADESIEAYRKAYLGDPAAAMGGILACNFDINADFAQMVMETYDRFGRQAGAGGFFVEVWIAPVFDDDAMDLIRTTKKWGKRVRLLTVGDMSREPDQKGLEYKSITGGMLVQSRDLVGLNEDQWKVVARRPPSDAEMDDLRLAWLVCKHTKSNAISICKDGRLIGNGAGQMSRVMSCRIATWLAEDNGHAEELKGSVAASDAFFPFADGPGILIDAGVTAIIQPGGSKRDEETIAACDARGAAMIFTGTRHFKH